MKTPVVEMGSWKLIHGPTVLWLGSSITSCGPPISRPPRLVSAVGYIRLHLRMLLVLSQLCDSSHFFWTLHVPGWTLFFSGAALLAYLVLAICAFTFAQYIPDEVFHLT